VAIVKRVSETGFVAVFGWDAQEAPFQLSPLERTNLHLGSGSINGGKMKIYNKIGEICI
jgi:hypothetical protein